MIEADVITANSPLSGPKSGSTFRFNGENARFYSEKAVKAKHDRKVKLEAEALAGRLATPQSERLAKQITRIEELMEKTSDEDRLQKLSAAHQRLFSAWMVLSGTQRPGVRKSSRRPDRAMVEPTPQPVSDTMSEPQRIANDPNEPNG